MSVRAAQSARAAVGIVAVVSATVMAYTVAVPWGPVLAILWLAIACWASADFAADEGLVTPSDDAAPPQRRALRRLDGLEVWFWISLGIAAVAALIVVVLLASMLHWEWLAQRVGGVLTPTGAVVVAAIASAGAARTLMSQSEIARRDRFDDAERLKWERFAKGAEQLADSREFTTRASGVYALAALADDWIRHHRRRREVFPCDPRRTETAECEIIVDTLCAHLRRNTHLEDAITPATRDERKLVNEAVLGSIQWHARSPDGLWSGQGLIMDLRNTDLAKVLWQGVDLGNAFLKNAVLFDADLSGANLDGADLRDADLRSTWLTDAKVTATTQFKGAIYDDRTKWPTAEFSIPSDAVYIETLDITVKPTPPDSVGGVVGNDDE